MIMPIKRSTTRAVDKISPMYFAQPGFRDLPAKRKFLAVDTMIREVESLSLGTLEAEGNAAA